MCVKSCFALLSYWGSLSKSRLRTPPRRLKVWQESKCLFWMFLYRTIDRLCVETDNNKHWTTAETKLHFWTPCEDAVSWRYQPIHVIVSAMHGWRCVVHLLSDADGNKQKYYGKSLSQYHFIHRKNPHIQTMVWTQFSEVRVPLITASNDSHRWHMR
jgi:hypothetical protein